MNSETTRLKTLETKAFEKFGFKFSYGMVTEHHKKWVRVYRDETGKEWTQEELTAAHTNSALPAPVGLTQNYEDSGSTCPSAYVQYVKFTDPSEEVVEAPIEVLGTAEGPIMAIIDIMSPTEPDIITLLDPCVIIYDGKSRINLQPIFNVARRLRVKRDVVRSVGTPSEVLLALYPAFIIQNRMASYQLRPLVPLVISPELTNEAELANS